MAMLAEPRSKQKWSLNPRGVEWANDDTKFGQKLMEKMGWCKGKGLGREEQGNKDHITVKLKTDSKGIGYKGKDDEWIKHYEGFENVLASLNSKENSTANSKNNSTCNSTANSDNEEDELKGVSGKSLEAASKTSRARVHYHKFTRGKDVSRYNADDIGCILGSKRAKILAEAEAQEEVELGEDAEKEEEVGHIDHVNGLTTIKGGNVQEYFAKKMEALKKKIKIDSMTSEDKTCEDNLDEDSLPARPSFGLGLSCYDEEDTIGTSPYQEQAEYKSKKKRLLDVDGNKEIESGEGQVNGDESHDKGWHSVKEQNQENGIENGMSKKKKKSKHVEIEENEANDRDLPSCSFDERHTKTKKKRKSKKDSIDKVEFTEEVSVDTEDNPESKKKKKKKKKEVETLAEDNCPKIGDTSIEKRGKKINKNKGQDHENINEYIDNQSMRDIGTINNETDDVSSKKSKKKKKKHNNSEI